MPYKNYLANSRIIAIVIFPEGNILSFANVHLCFLSNVPSWFRDIDKIYFLSVLLHANIFHMKSVDQLLFHLGDIRVIKQTNCCKSDVKMLKRDRFST